MGFLTTVLNTPYILAMPLSKDGGDVRGVE